LVPIGLVYSINDSSEGTFKKMIDASQKMIDDMANSSNNNNDEEGIYKKYYRYFFLLIL
jgi:hypothetical protein